MRHYTLTDASKDEDIKQKNDIIIHEVRRNQTIIDRAVQNGVSCAAL